MHSRDKVNRVSAREEEKHLEGKNFSLLHHMWDNFSMIKKCFSSSAKCFSPLLKHGAEIINCFISSSRGDCACFNILIINNF